jgi:hypothetical protein
VTEQRKIANDLRSQELRASQGQKTLKQAAKTAKALRDEEWCAAKLEAELQRKQAADEKKRVAEAKKQAKAAKKEAEAAAKKAKEERGPYNYAARCVAIKGGKKPGPKGPHKNKKVEVPEEEKRYKVELRKHQLSMARALRNESSPPSPREDRRGKKRIMLKDIGEPPAKPASMIMREAAEEARKVEEARKAEEARKLVKEQLRQEADEDFALLMEAQEKKEKEAEMREEGDASSSVSSDESSDEQASDSEDEVPAPKAEARAPSSSSSSSSESS